MNKSVGHAPVDHVLGGLAAAGADVTERSEEHTSELHHS